MFRAIIVTLLAVLLAAATTIPKPLHRQPQQQTSGTSQQANADIRGTAKLPLVVQVLPASKTKEETAQEKTDRQDVSSANWWMVRLTGVIGLIGLLQLVVFGRQAQRLKQTIEKMDEIAAGQTADMKASIGEATRAASAMEGVASSMAANVESVKASVATSREIADRQKLVTELQSRAYISVNFFGMVPQNSKTGYRFEPKVIAINNGHTPAYKLHFRANADVLPFPLPDDFKFPLPAFRQDGSICVVGPGQNKILSAAVPKLYPPIEVEQLKGGVGQRIYIWGEVLYEDAFGIARFVKFGQSFFWLEDGTTVMSHDTRGHNDSN